ncbi:hypothetical protein A3A84_01170 [Candidatus Collierbacteria bacterium RIFCSPLOWO2_01_FULL_50_23]|uniref:Uncharacterized protein n=2 Tax=Candidatus Collieribacteriota TaxID=1752725 RepID=A0A1F5ESU8_9BACT|nr:MAG: hypothetical protein A3D09_00780 [Candidatus Collierbacteria bacterium RIFCSPHIGHO2_02_FULL_49_10]OGD72406.1 MAG: hypothetical protein A2703_00295 [Candidatus Collierbacteria bacterium RIFCSPHIGHO2_01_FULL_50_25]OGD74270.1 MAG: hypothetical protein A3A84_01170 [Candidatus Collierbacteria bacterium RIFCSPLOWO2_01_FULL_50_23]
MRREQFFLPAGVRLDGAGFYKEKVVVSKERLDSKEVLVGVLADEIVNGTDSVPGDFRVNPGRFREYDDVNPQFGSVTDFCIAAARFVESYGLTLSEVMADLEEAVRLAAVENESGYQTAFRKRAESGEQLRNLPNDIEHAVINLTRMYGKVLVLKDYVDGRLQATPRGGVMGLTSYTSRQHKEPTAYELSVQARLDEIRAKIVKRFVPAQMDSPIVT